MKIKDENLHHQSALNGLSPLLIAATVEQLALPIQQNIASLHAALVALALIMDDTMDWLKKAKLALQTLACHNDIIVDATQHHLNEAEPSIWWLIEHDVANALALKTQYGQLVALKLWVEKIKEDGISTVGQLQKEAEDIKLHQFAKICGDINRVSTAMNTLDENIRHSLDHVHLHVDVLLQRTTTSPVADVQATSPSALALAPQPAPTPTPEPNPVRAPYLILAPDPTLATGLTPAPTPAPAQLPAWAHGQMPAPHPHHPLFPDACKYIDNRTVATTLQPPWNLYQGTPTQPSWNLYQGMRVDPYATDRGEHLHYGTRGPCFLGSLPTVDINDNLDDNKDKPLGGQIVSPHHWDCCQLAQKAGHSPLNGWMLWRWAARSTMAMNAGTRISPQR
jgi:hypothetical protein